MSQRKHNNVYRLENEKIAEFDEMLNSSGGRKRTKRSGAQQNRKSKKGYLDTSAETLETQRSLGVKKTISKHDVKLFEPQNERQAAFLDAYASECPLIFQSGFAATGKSTYTLYHALLTVLDPNTPQNKIVIIRSPESTNDIGHLPGTLEEKSAVYELPYYQIFADILNFKNPYPILKELGLVEFKLTSFLRGLTIDNAVIVMDECQNTDTSELRTVLTRIGKTSRIVLCGDSKQDDIERKRRKSSFNYLNKLLLLMPYGRTATIKYEKSDCLRHDLVREILEADYSIED